MKDQLVSDEILTGMCFALDFKYFFERTAKIQAETRTLYSVIKQWLWDKHEITLVVKQTVGFKVFNCQVIKNFSQEIFATWKSDSPITAENEGIQKAVEYLYTQLKKK